jgi:mannose-1-phosphate guanylyltransferase
MSEKIANDTKKVAVIMAGGLGSKLWPRSLESSPKQFNHFIGEGSMIQNTVLRILSLFDYNDIYIVTNEQLGEIVRADLPELPTENIILEPFGKNTAPCLALAATAMDGKYTDDTVMVAFPSDHIIVNEREFHQSLETAISGAHDIKGIFTIGIKPSRADIGFGYIQIKDEVGILGDFFNQSVRHSANFAEKPDLATAKRFVESGDFLWNSGIFVWRLDTFWEAFAEFLPDHYRLFGLLRKVAEEEKKTLIQDIYREMASESVDYAILEKSVDVYVVQSTFGWSDLGNWDELYRLSMKDARDNFIEGDVVAINTTNCLISSQGKPIGVIGVKDLIIVESDKAIMICQRGDSDNVAEIVDYMRRKQINTLL